MPKRYAGALAFALAVSCLDSLDARAAEERRPNIIFILSDDLSYHDLGCYGQKHIETPHIDRLYREGMRFTQAYAGACECAPTRCSLITGKHMGHARIRLNRSVRGQDHLLDKDVTVAGVLKQQVAAKRKEAADAGQLIQLVPPNRRSK